MSDQPSLFEQKLQKHRAEWEDRPTFREIPTRDLQRIPTEPNDATEAEMDGGDHARKNRQATAGAILERLKAGPATNHELLNITPRFGARIYDLRQLGHKISTKNRGHGTFEYELHVA